MRKNEPHQTPKIKRPPRIKAVPLGPVETVEEFMARGGKVERLQGPKGGIGIGAQPVGRGAGWR